MKLVAVLVGLFLFSGASALANDPFETAEVGRINPINLVKYDEVLIGPTYPARSGYEFSHYRYVTFYNVKKKKERVSQLPVIREECHDESALFAALDHTYSFTASVNVSVSFEGLGLSSNMSKTRSFRASRNLRATGGKIANHTAYFMKEDWTGMTLIQMYSPTKRKAEWVMEKNNGGPSWMRFFFPTLSKTMKYPLHFSIQDAEWTFIVERKILSTCTSSQMF